jgi:plasmid stabilization system protein ParE
VAKVVWRRRAVRHLHEIHEYIREHNPSAAADYIAHLYDTCLSLAQFPEKARRYSRKYRALAFRNHLVFYRYERRSDLLTIIAIIDGRRDIKTLVQVMSEGGGQ